MKHIVCLALALACTFPSISDAAPTADSICQETGKASFPRALHRHNHIMEEMKQWKGIHYTHYSPSPPLFEKQVAAFLERPDEAIILYAIDEAHLCSFLWVGSESMVYARVPNQYPLLIAPMVKAASDIISEGSNKNNALASRLSQLRTIPEVEEAFRALPASDADPENSLDILSALLFPKDLQGPLKKVRHLTIVPVGAISSIPISALRLFETTERVVDRFSVNILLFVDALGNKRRRWDSKFTKPLIIGNPSGRDAFSFAVPLLGAEEEAKYAASKFGGNALTGTKATTSAVHALAPGADLIYFATHGVSSPTETRHGTGQQMVDPLRRSFLVLSDDRLSASTVLSMGFEEWKARLVVLSACQSGLGWVAEGGVMGMARTFLDRGVGNVAMTTWNVDDEATGYLMRNFVDLLEEHQPAEALRLAQLATLPRHKEKVYWSAFNMYGNPFSGSW